MPYNGTSKSFLLLLVLNLALFVFGQGGTQFITGVCTSDADCASGCCGFNTGKCAGPVIAQERDGGCGFGDGTPNDRAAQAFRNGQATTPATNTPPANNGNANTGNTGNTGSSGSTGTGTQFITGVCTSDADCASGCCGFNTGKCAGAIVAQERDGGCGFGDGTPNDRAAQALRGGQATTPASSAPPATGNTGNTGSTGGTGGATNINQSAPGAQNVGKGNAAQFITGQCLSDADCASGCCGFNTGKCAGAIIAQTRDGGCGFGNATPNDNAAKALRGAGKRDVEFTA
ncbi:hypothetical protein LTR84_009075 [Exophiala bonariae]|uniref:Biotrophy-associated secreted protein 2 n=1 Tax=Exophiala bonariae TaxID=1690606 RepID=A0AAV9MZ99_9EURO|nr:hypothetical protein LTR84_009075 [Exophiala bonariae]